MCKCWLIILGRKVVINYDWSFNAIYPQLKKVNSCCVGLLSNKKIANTVWVFGNAAESGKIVAVAKLSLVYVVRTNVSVEDSLADFHFRDSLPWESFGSVLCE